MRLESALGSGWPHLHELGSTLSNSTCLRFHDAPDVIPIQMINIL